MLGIVVAVAMLGTIAASADTSTHFVIGNGTIISVNGLIQGTIIPIGSTINLSAPGPLVIQYKGTTIFNGSDGDPSIVIPGLKATFSGAVVTPPIPTYQYFGTASKLTTNPNQWTLVLTVPAYATQSVTLGIKGPLTIE